MFVPNLLGQLNAEQQAKWVKKAQDYKIIGCYAQVPCPSLSNNNCK